MPTLTAALILSGALLFGGCSEEGPATTSASASNQEAGDTAQKSQVQRVLRRSVNQIEARADSIMQALKPVPLLRSSDRRALRRYLNPQQLARARQLGVPRPADSTELASLEGEGRLVRLADSSQYWVIRELNYSVPYVTPDVEALLTEIGQRFQARLEERGLPPLRMVLTSVLRTSENQRVLRQTNPNATSSTSTHEFGTTVDVAYGSYAAPQQPLPVVENAELPWLKSYLDYTADKAVEAAAARKSRELQAILGHVLRDVQAEGKVMVTLEQLQPVYHMTVASRLASQSG